MISNISKGLSPLLALTASGQYISTPWADI